MHPPKIFISATSGDLRSIRQIVKEALLTINCHPVEQTNFEPDARTVADMLRGKIGGCQALIHICGMRYGAEPDVASLPPGTPRRSYTQMEYHIGRQLQDERGDDHFRVYTFICPENFPYDQEPDTESQEKRDLQRAHRTRLFDDPHLREKPVDGDDLKLRVLALQEQVFSLQHEQAEVKTEVLKNRHLGLKAFAVLLLLFGGLYVGMHFLQRGQDQIIAGQKLDAPALRARLAESSERGLQLELQAAELTQKSDERQRLKDAALAANKNRLTRIDDLVANFILIEGRADATEEVKEMNRILQDEGVDPALRFIEGKRASLLARVAATEARHLEEKRSQLQPLLQAASLQATKGNVDLALKSFEELLLIDDEWSDAISRLHDLFDDLRKQSYWRGTPTRDMAEASQMLAIAEKVTSKLPDSHLAKNLVSVAFVYRGRALINRGQPGDAEQAFEFLTKALAQSQVVLAANPNQPRAHKDVLISLRYLANFLDSRDQPGDAEQALAHFQRSQELAEKLLAANPDSAEAARDVAIGLAKLGGCLARRGQPGDAEQALAHFQRNQAICEKLLAAHPDSAEAARDLSVSHYKLGNFFTNRGQPGDAEQALVHIQRDLEISEKLLAAHPDSAEAVRDVSQSLEMLGTALSKRNQPGDDIRVAACFERCILIASSRVKANPDSASSSSDLADILMEYGNHYERTGKGDAHALWQQAYEILHSMEEKDIFLSAEDKKSLETLRGKLGAK